jgi:hypothetical protein
MFMSEAVTFIYLFGTEMNVNGKDFANASFSNIITASDVPYFLGT